MKKMKKMLLIIVIIFIVCILIQYNYLVENFEDINIEHIILTDENTQLLFTSDNKNLRDSTGSIYLQLLTSDYSLLLSKVDELKKSKIPDTLTHLEAKINNKKYNHYSGRDVKNVYIIGSNSYQSTPSFNNMEGVWYNIAGEFLKYIDGVIYVYSGLIEKENIDEIHENGLDYYLEGWIRHDLRKITNSEPDIEIIEKYANDYGLDDDSSCLHTNEFSKIYNLEHLNMYKDTGTKAAWKVTIDGEYRNGNTYWRNGMKYGLKKELGIRLGRTIGPENGNIEPLFKVDHPYCGDSSKLRITANTPFVDINKVDLYFGPDQSELPAGETAIADPLPLHNPSLKSFKTIDLTIPVNMTHECAVAARRSIKRANGNTLELYQDKRNQACELTELKKIIYEFKDVIIRPAYSSESISPTLVTQESPESPPVPTPVLPPIPTPVLPPVPREVSLPLPVNIPSYNYNLIRPHVNNRFKFF